MPSFQKKLENFVCEHCGEKVVGSGYTNHCPKCLWAKHVDVVPGDRQAKCGGLMEPVTVRKKSGKWQIKQKCLKCGYTFWCKVSQDDNFDEIIRLSL